MKSLLLLHGAIGSAEQMQPLADELKKHFDVHTFNFSGHGGLSTDIDFSIEQFAADLENYIIENNLHTVNVLGYSMGGYVALFLAAKRPELFFSIMTHGTKFNWTPEIAEKEAKMLNAEKIEEKIPAFANALKQRHHPADWKIVLEKTATMMKKMGDTPPLSDDLLSKINIPVRISIGDRDEMVTLEETTHVYKTLLNSSMQVLPNTKHPVEKINPALIVNASLEFFK